MPGMADTAYPLPIHNPGSVDGEQAKREFQERQKRSHKAIRERKRLAEEAVRIARETGDATKLRALKPLYE
jgi:hypothetical protein